MLRFAGLFVVVAACGGSGFESGAATITGIMPAVQSASAVSFTGPDAAGNMVLGWTIDFYENGPGADCQSSDVTVNASLGIFTNQTADATHTKASLAGGDSITIVTDSPPTIIGDAAATMGAVGIGGIHGVVQITTFHLRPDLSADLIEGTISAGGNDSNSNPVSLDGMFSAPVCE